MELWVVGEISQSNHKEWEFVGVFSSKGRAELACLGELYFVGSVYLDTPAPPVSVPWPGAYYPKMGK